jgi:hypothetical protein
VNYADRADNDNRLRLGERKHCKPANRARIAVVICGAVVVVATFNIVDTNMMTDMHILRCRRKGKQQQQQPPCQQFTVYIAFGHDLQRS